MGLTSRPGIPIGGYGEIAFLARGKGKVEARTRFRDWDGQTRLVQATASSRPVAEVALKKKLTQRNAFQLVDTTLTPDSPFPALVAYWLADLDLEDRIARATRFNYERDLNRLVLPAFKGFTLREIGVARCDVLLRQTRQQLLLVGQAGEDGATAVVRVRAWELTGGSSGPNPDGQLGQIVEVMLGTSARMGEVLAIRRRDLDLTTTPATLRICGTVISERGVGTYREEHPKTDRSNRVIALPTFAAEALRRRLAIMADRSLDALVFRSRGGTPLTTANVRRQLRKVLGDAGIEGVSPHMFRRTVATVINEQASLNLAAELLGHTDPKVTIEHYIRRNEQVNPLTAELLDAAFARDDDGTAS